MEVVRLSDDVMLEERNPVGLGDIDTIAVVVGEGLPDVLWTALLVWVIVDLGEM